MDKFDFLEAYPTHDLKHTKLKQLGISFATASLVPFDPDSVFKAEYSSSHTNPSQWAKVANQAAISHENWLV